jgi:hypothetical protein
VECEEGCETGDNGCVRSACANHDDGEYVDINERPVSSHGVREVGVFIANELCDVREVVVGAIFSFPYLHVFNREMATLDVRVSDVHGFEDLDEVRFVSKWSQRGGI